MMKRQKEIAETVDKRSGEVRGQGKHKKKKGNNMFKELFDDAIGKIFEVKAEVPDLGKEFYEDQCNKRKMYIGMVDKEETDKRLAVMRKQQRKEELKEIAVKKSLKLKEKECKEADRYKRIEWGKVKVAKIDSNESGKEEENDSEYRTRPYGKSTKAGRQEDRPEAEKVVW